MKERPILFSAPMVRAILSGIKTQTRRVVKKAEMLGGWETGHNARGDEISRWPLGRGLNYSPCPYGQPGDRLWVRETYFRDEEDGAILYAANPDDFEVVHHNKVETGSPRYNWKPSIFMPRWASRITMEITGVRVERLQYITADDAMAEGIVRLPDGGYAADKEGRHYHAASAWHSYGSLWESINGPGSWEANPWVWAIEFRRVKGDAT